MDHRIFVQVVDVGVLLEPVVSEAREAAVQEARVEAEETAIAALTQELTSQEAGSGGGEWTQMQSAHSR